MAAQRHTGSAFINLSQIKRYTGSVFTDVSFGRRWTGSAWEQFWPLSGGPYNLDESTTAIGSTFNLTKTVQGF